VNTRSETAAVSIVSLCHCVAVSLVVTKRTDSSCIHKRYDIENLVSHIVALLWIPLSQHEHQLNDNDGPSEFLCSDFNGCNSIICHLCINKTICFPIMHFSATYVNLLLFKMSSSVHD
jgi:hypothetical protein